MVVVGTQRPSTSRRTAARWTSLATACCGLLVTSGARASELVEVLPLTDRILMVHFDDGKVTVAAPGQNNQSGDAVIVAPLDTARASATDTYRISSADDAAYATPLPPSRVGRKTKGTEFSNHCDSWQGRCVNTGPDRAHEHWLYLALPSPLQRGKIYQIDTGSLGSNTAKTTLVFDETKLRSEAVHTNIVAYAARSQAKLGYVYHWLGDMGGLDVAPLVGRPCRLVRTSDRAVVFSSTLAFRKGKDNPETAQAADTYHANFLGSDVADCDFSAFDAAGEYVLSVDGVGSSFPFRIEADALRKPFLAAMKGLFIQRSGIEIEAKHADGYSRPAPHHPGVTPGFAGKLKYTTTRYFDVNGDGTAVEWEAGIKGDIDTWGWYQDAGDWDAYFTHSAIPAWLLHLFEQHPDHFTDGELNIPESGNGIPDVLDEGRWLVRFYHRTRHAILDKGYGTGGVGGVRVMGDLWGADLPGGIVAGSWQDTQRTWVVSGEDPWTTYRYAALAAHLATILKTIGKPDPEGIDWKQEAEASWTWAQANTRAGDGTRQGVSLQKMRMHAAVALYRLTGTPSYHDAFKTDFAQATEAYDDDARFWLLMYAGLPADRVDAAIQGKCRASLEKRAGEQLADPANDRATRWGGDFAMPMLVGQSSTPLVADGALALGVLTALAPDTRRAMESKVYTTADYFLGTNPLNMTWITRLGPRSPKGPFHLDGFASGAQFPPPGIIPYGPVATARDWMPQPPQGPWSSNWPNSSVYPTDIETWPGHERWFDQRTGIANCEFTIHQTTVLTAVVYGSLLDVPSAPPELADGGAGPADGTGADGGADSAAPGADESDSSCGCRTVHANGTARWWAVLASALALAALVRRSRRAR